MYPNIIHVIHSEQSYELHCEIQCTVVEWCTFNACPPGPPFLLAGWVLPTHLPLVCKAIPSHPFRLQACRTHAHLYRQPAAAAAARRQSFQAAAAATVQKFTRRCGGVRCHTDSHAQHSSQGGWVAYGRGCIVGVVFGPNLSYCARSHKHKHTHSHTIRSCFKQTERRLRSAVAAAAKKSRQQNTNKPSPSPRPSEPRTSCGTCLMGQTPDGAPLDCFRLECN